MDEVDRADLGLGWMFFVGADGSRRGREALFWEHEGNAAVRVGDWKLVRVGRNGEWELYDLAKDRTELKNVAAQEPARVKELAAKWNAWADRAHVKPYPGQGKGGKKNAAEAGSGGGGGSP